VFLDSATTGDGLLTAVRFLSKAAGAGIPVEQLASRMRRYPQVMINVPVRNREAQAHAEAVDRAVAAASADLGDRGRVLVRPSGTEPVVRVMVEAESDEIAGAHAEAVASAVRAAFA
jgi:phosphoglucosamine mutase